jgi:hypothetical protein
LIFRLLLGATTYMGFKGYWPAAEDPESSPAVAGDPGMADLHRETGRRPARRRARGRAAMLNHQVADRDAAAH